MDNLENTKTEEKEFAKERRQIWFEQFMYGWERQNQMADDFNKLLTEIVSIIFVVAAGLSPLISDKFTLGTKHTFVVGLGILIISLFLGLLNMQLRQDFWNKANGVNASGIEKLEKARRGEISLKEAEEFCAGLTQGSKNISSPKYAWQLQLIFMFIGVLLLFFSFANFIL